MRLADWVGQNGRGALMRLSERSGICYPTVHAIYSGTQTPKYDTAEKLSAATNGEVTIAELCKPAVSNGKTSRNSRPRINRPRTPRKVKPAKSRKRKARAA